MVIGCAGLAAVPLGSAEAAAPEVEAPVQEASPVVVSTATRLPAVEVVTAKRVRHDWYVGFGFGLGAGNFQRGAATSGAFTGLVRVGGRVTDKVAVGGLLVTSAGGSKTGVSGFSSLLAEALFFPVRGRGLGLAVGLGLSSAWLRAPESDGTAVERTTQTGAAFGLGLGYDFWLARRFNLGLWLRGDGSGGRYGVRAAGTFGLAFSWY